MKMRCGACTKFDYYFFLSLLLFLCAFIFYVFTSPIEKTFYFFSDDAYYYFKVAQNIVAGNGLTFDGFNMTNGYHPLWMIALLPIFALTQSNPELSLKLVLALQSLLAFLSFSLCWLYIKKIANSFLSILAVMIMLSFPSLFLLLNGLESGLLVFLIFLILFVDKNNGLLDYNASPSKKILLGFLFAAIVLARLDMVFFIVSFTLFQLALSPADHSFLGRMQLLFRQYWQTALTLSISVLPNFIFNYMVFGHLMPISGAVKISFPIPHFNFTESLLLYSFPLLLSIPWVLYSSSRRGYLRKKLFTHWPNSSYSMVAIFWLGSLIHLIWTFLFMQWGVYPWHFASYIPILVTLSIATFKMILERFTNSLLAKASLSIFLFALGFGISFIICIEKGVHHLPRYEAAMWARENTPRNSVFALHDAGMFSYFSNRPTINLDGVINSYEFQDRILRDNLMDFFKKNNVKYIASAFNVNCHSPRKFFTHSILAYRGRNFRKPIGYDVLVTNATEIYASKSYIYKPYTDRKIFCFVIWDFSGVKLKRLKKN